MIPSQWACPAAYPEPRAISPGRAIMRSGDPRRAQDPGPPSGPHGRLRALGPPEAADDRDALVRGREGVQVPGPLGGDGLDDYWMHGVLRGLWPCWHS